MQTTYTCGVFKCRDLFQFQNVMAGHYAYQIGCVLVGHPIPTQNVFALGKLVETTSFMGYL